MRAFLVACLSLAAASAIASGASAQSITNGGFEAVQIPVPFGNSVNPADIPGWTHAGTVGDALLWNERYCDGGGCIKQTGDGSQFVTLGGGFGQHGTASWTQTVNGLSPGTAYVLSFDIAYEGADTLPVGQSITASFGTTSQTYAATPNNVNYWDVWEPETLNFVASAASEDVVFSVTNGFNDIGLDAVSLSLAQTGGGGIPEPGTWALMIGGFGLLGLVLRRRRTALA